MYKKLIVTCFASAVGSSLLMASPSQNMADIYQARCANCHGDEANGVSKIKAKELGDLKDAAGKGVSLDKSENYFGSPLNTLSQEELLTKLQDLRKHESEADAPHSVMRKNLTEIEKRDGKVSDEEMAKYIYETFGAGHK